MFHRNKKTRKYQAPDAKVTHMTLESNFCATLRFNVQVYDLDNVNESDSDEQFYFESN